MAPQIVVVAIAIVVFLQVVFLARDTPAAEIITRPFADPPVRVSHDDIEDVLAVPTQPFPRKIWQTSKNGPAGLDDSDKEAVKTWTKLNQKWRYESITQYSAESYLREGFRDRPEIVEIFTDLQDPILRADLIRYLVLLRDGGLYSDLDTKVLKPIEDWIPAQYQAETNVVIGVEYDKLDGGRWVDWTLDLQFTTWSILAKPQHPLLEHVVSKVMRNLRDLAIDQETTVAKVRPSFHQVLDATGPAAFSRAVFEYLSIQLGESYTWKNVTNLKRPLLVKDILILPITAFGCGQFHSNAGGIDDPTALVQHLFKGSWKGDHSFAKEPSKKDKEEEEKKKERERKEEEEKKKEEEERKKDEVKKKEEESKKQEKADKKNDEKKEDEDKKKEENKSSEASDEQFDRTGVKLSNHPSAGGKETEETEDLEEK